MTSFSPTSHETYPKDGESRRQLRQLCEKRLILFPNCLRYLTLIIVNLPTPQTPTRIFNALTIKLDVKKNNWQTLKKFFLSSNPFCFHESIHFQEQPFSILLFGNDS